MTQSDIKDLLTSIVQAQHGNRNQERDAPRAHVKMASLPPPKWDPTSPDGCFTKEFVISFNMYCDSTAVPVEERADLFIQLLYKDHEILTELASVRLRHLEKVGELDETERKKFKEEKRDIMVTLFHRCVQIFRGAHMLPSTAIASHVAELRRLQKAADEPLNKAIHRFEQRWRLAYATAEDDTTTVRAKNEALLNMLDVDVQHKFLEQNAMIQAAGGKDQMTLSWSRFKAAMQSLYATRDPEQSYKQMKLQQATEKGRLLAEKRDGVVHTALDADTSIAGTKMHTDRYGNHTLKPESSSE